MCCIFNYIKTAPKVNLHLPEPFILEDFTYRATIERKIYQPSIWNKIKGYFYISDNHSCHVFLLVLLFEENYYAIYIPPTLDNEDNNTILNGFNVHLISKDVQRIIKEFLKPDSIIYTHHTTYTYKEYQKLIVPIHILART